MPEFDVANALAIVAGKKTKGFAKYAKESFKGELDAL